MACLFFACARWVKMLEVERYAPIKSSWGSFLRTQRHWTVVNTIGGCDLLIFSSTSLVVHHRTIKIGHLHNRTVKSRLNFPYLTKRKRETNKNELLKSFRNVCFLRLSFYFEWCWCWCEMWRERKSGRNEGLKVHSYRFDRSVWRSLPLSLFLFPQSSSAPVTVHAFVCRFR